MVTEMAHVANWKKAEIKSLSKLISSNPVVGLVDIGGIPGPQIQLMRQNLRDEATLKVSKIKLLLLALEQMEGEKEGIIEMVQTLNGQMGLITTDMNPFKLFQLLERSKTPAPVKGGETAPEDIEIKGGETAFKPGPIVGELQRAGIPAAIEQGKVIIKADKVVAKAGDKISPELAQMLTRLEIYPITVGLDLSAVYENGKIFQKSDLDIDPQQYLDNLAYGAHSAFNLAVNIGFMNSVTVLPLLQTAHAKAINLMFNAGIISPSSIDYLLSKASGQMLNLAAKMKPKALDDELKGKLGSVSTSAAPPPAKEPAADESKAKDEDEKKKKKDKEEEKEVSEEEAAAGLGALFD
jgi:large subunit ribosomal protein L10